MESVTVMPKAAMRAIVIVMASLAGCASEPIQYGPGQIRVDEPERFDATGQTVVDRWDPRPRALARSSADRPGAARPAPVPVTPGTTTTFSPAIVALPPEQFSEDDAPPVLPAPLNQAMSWSSSSGGS